VLSAALALCGSIAGAQQVYTDTVYYDRPDEAGRLTGGITEMLIDLGDPDALPPRAAWVSLGGRDGDANRVGLVFVGDGYTQGQLGLYADHVDSLAAEYFAREPNTTYAPLFNVYRIDVVSNESGVDHDPVEGIFRDTALDMGFWCNGIERLLCVDVGKAKAFAANAPRADLVAAIANSEMYGGAGYIQSDLATAAAANFWASEVFLHEFGHALGDLADEYDYGGGDTYNGPEVPEVNASIRSTGEMEVEQAKWFRWLGVNDPAWDGLVGAFEGCRYYRFGINRPTDNSLMRSLGRPFNLPGAEAIIINIYKKVKPIDAASPGDVVYDGSETLFVDPVDPAGHALSVQWTLNGEAIEGATGHELDLRSVDLPEGFSVVGVTVRDATPWVRDEAARAKWMTQSLSFAVVFDGACYADFTGDGKLDLFDFLAFVNAFNAGDPAADCSKDGALDLFDFLCFTNGFNAGC
jgi:hypothetical protein